MEDNIKFRKGLLIFILYLIVLPVIGAYLVKDATIAGPLVGLLWKLPINAALQKNLLLLSGELLSFLVIIFILRKNIKKDYVLFKTNYKKCISTALKYWLLGVFLMMIANYLINVVFFSGAIASNEEANRELIKLYPLYAIPSLVLFAPIVEELVFRRAFRDCIKNKALFVILTTIVFASIHLLAIFTEEFVFATDWPQLLYIFPYSALGFCFAMAYIKTNTIFSSILIHILQNIISLAIILLAI